MYTVITETTLKPGEEQQWDAAFEERAKAVRNQPGWIDLQLLIPEGESNKRVVVGTWESREAWERWHQAQEFKQTRSELDEATVNDGRPTWYQVRVAEPLSGASA